MDLLILTACVFATYRLATDMAGEAGPFELYARWRGAVMSRYGPDSWVSEGVSCPICMSFWIGLVVTLLVVPLSWLWPLWWLAIAGASSYLARRDG